MQLMVTFRNTVSIATVSALLASPRANAQRIEETPSAGLAADAGGRLASAVAVGAVCQCFPFGGVRLLKRGNAGRFYRRKSGG